MPSTHASMYGSPGSSLVISLSGTLRNFNDFSTLPLSIMSYSDDPDEQLETLNTLTVNDLINARGVY